MDFNQITIKNFKCFKDTTFNMPSQINLIIGKNNSGKSSLLDAMDFLFSRKTENNFEQLTLVKKLSKDDLQKCIDLVIAQNPFSYGYKEILQCSNELVGKDLHIVISKDHNPYFENMGEIDNVFSKYSYYSANRYIDLSKLYTYIDHSIHDKQIVKISSERDVLPEENDDFHKIKENGTGVTNELNHLLNDKDADYSLVRKDILNDLNLILCGENKYTGIEVLYDRAEKKYEIFLFENEQRIAMSQMGSGLKTLIFVLLQLHLHKDNNDIVFMFEELENNLHPEIQRRLFEFIYDFCIKNGKTLFLTSHSYVAINCFYSKKNTTIYHIEKNENGNSEILTVDSFMSKANILDDLGVLASDLFQTNGIIWVEGPSDRIYIKKWIELYDNSLKENVDYSFLYYGGKTLSHYTANDDAQDDEKLLKILLTNRNSAIVMDSDLKKRTESLGRTKKRVIEEFNKNNLFSGYLGKRNRKLFVSQ